jgi:glutamine synthetase
VILPDDLDTVAIGVPSTTGRLMGKRVTRAVWERVCATGSFTMPEFHLVSDLGGDVVEGLPAVGGHSGWGNGYLRPDLDSWRRLPWDPGTALVLCDALDANGKPAETAPRWILRRQLERLEERGLSARAASELEFYLYRTSYEEAARKGYRKLRPAYHRHGDNDLLVDGHLEGPLGDIRRMLPEAGIPVEVTQGEGGIGQFEVTLSHSKPLEMADRHLVYKHGVKALAQRHGLAATFMAKVEDDQAGSGCHLHLSLMDAGERSVFAGDQDGLSPFGRAFLGGVLRYCSELCLLLAPYPNSYRRLQPGSWAPAAVTWGLDNRTCLLRVCGAPDATRLEFRLPGADVNPYLGFAALVAAGLSGVDEQIEPGDAIVGDAYRTEVQDSATALPRDIGAAVDALAGSDMARAAFGSEVCDHLVGLGAHEAALDRRHVSDADLVRCFETA